MLMQHPDISDQLHLSLFSELLKHKALVHVNKHLESHIDFIPDCSIKIYDIFMLQPESWERKYFSFLHLFVINVKISFVKSQSEFFMGP